MTENKWREYILKGLIEALNDFDTVGEVGAFYVYIVDYDEALCDSNNIVDVELNAIWNFADYTFFLYEHKEDGWEDMLLKLREVVEKMENNQPITDPEVLKYSEVRMKKNKDFVGNSNTGCLLSIPFSFILYFLGYR
jgi:hypothetical protein